MNTSKVQSEQVPSLQNGEMHDIFPSNSTTLNRSRSTSNADTSTTILSAEAKSSTSSQHPVPTYPISAKKLQELNKSSKINVFVNDRGVRELLFAVPKAILAYFSAAIYSSLQETQLVVLDGCNKKAVSWVMNWMCGGGKMPPITGQESKSNSGKTSKEPLSIETILQYIQVVSQLQVPGPLLDSLFSELETALLRSNTLSSDSVDWFYAPKFGNVTPRVRQVFVFGVIGTVMRGKVILPSICDPSHAIASAEFRNDLVRAVATPDFIGEVRRIQKRHPLTIDQLRFIYKFTSVEKSSNFRKSVARDLLALIDDGRVENIKAYHAYAWENNDFEADMATVIDAKEGRLAFLEREAKRKARGVQPQKKR